MGELLQAAQAAWATTISTGALLTTILSGYLIVAWVAGKDMSRSQIVIVNALYVAFYSLTLVSTHIFTMRATELMQIAVELSNERLSRPFPDIAHVLGVV